MGHHKNKWAKLNFVARHYDPYVLGHKGHNDVQQNSTWPICLCGDPYANWLSFYAPSYIAQNIAAWNLVSEYWSYLDPALTKVACFWTNWICKRLTHVWSLSAVPHFLKLESFQVSTCEPCMLRPPISQLFGAFIQDWVIFWLKHMFDP